MVGRGDSDKMIFSNNLWNNIVVGILTIYSMMLLTFVLSKTGVFLNIAMFLERIKLKSVVYLCWLFLGVIVSAVVPDTIAATILCPLAFLFAEKSNINKEKLILTVCFGTVLGSDFTYFGGGDNLISYILLTKFLGQGLDMNIWMQIFWGPTFWGLIWGTFVLWFCLFEKDKMVYYDEGNNYDNKRLSQIIAVLFFSFGIVLVCIKQLQPLLFLLALISVLVFRLDKKTILSLPKRPVIIWPLCILVGVLVEQVLKQHFVFLGSYVTNMNYVLWVTIIGFLTNLMTNTGLTTFVLPFVFSLSLSPDYKLWLYAITVKAINLSYFTVLANGSFAVGTSYGITFKNLFKYGILLFFVEWLSIITYFGIIKEVL